MKINKIFHLGATIILLITLGLFTGCAESISEKDSSTDESEVILRIPNLDLSFNNPETGALSRAGHNVDETSNEGKLNSLYLYVFEEDSENNTWTLTGEPENITSSSYLNSATYNTPYLDYKLKLKPGSYRFYLLGNFDEYVDGGSENLETLSTIEDIENLVLKFDNIIDGHNLPMACLSAIGTTESSFSNDQKFTVNRGEIRKEVYANISFVCSKVRYTILFDKSAEAWEFGKETVDFDNIMISNISNSTKVKEAWSESEWDEKYLPGKETIALFGRRYPVGIYPKNDGESEDLSGDRNSWTTNQRAWQCVFYLPENVNKNQKTNILLTGQCLDENSDKLYIITKEIELCPINIADEVLTRGCMYDIVMTVKNFNAYDVNVILQDWQIVDMHTDFSHTYLTIDKATAFVTSDSTDMIHYDTNSPTGLQFECVDNGELEWISEYQDGINSSVEPVIVGEIDRENQILILSINPDIDLSKLKRQEEGLITSKAQCFITAGNIRKQITVYYTL